MAPGTLRKSRNAPRPDRVMRMIIDLHVHTKPRSPCSQIDPLEMVAEARRIGLDGICLTEHNTLWNPSEAEELSRKGGISIFTANEITTDQGDILVYNYHTPVPDVVPIVELHREVAAAGGFMIAAHPLRGFKVFGVGQLKMTAPQAARRKVFQHVDAVEVRNGRLNDEENDMASHVAQQLKLVGVAGSDAHRIDEIGRWVMVFSKTVSSDTDLVEEIRAGRFTIGTARQPPA